MGCNVCVCSNLAYFDAASNVIENVLSVAVPLLQSTFTSDHFGPPRKQLNSFVLESGKNVTKSCVWVAKVLLLFSLSCPTYEEENEYFFCSTWNVHPRFITLTRD